MYHRLIVSLAVAVIATGVAAAQVPAVVAEDAPIAEQAAVFVDVPEGHVFQADVAWMADLGITRGCNPPANDRFCPDKYVTRGQMAAFLTRALNLTDIGGGNTFADDNGSVFEADIAKLAAAGITRGCNPPTNDRFCPDEFVTRGQMAAFLGRALLLSEGAGSDTFTDDDGSVFEADIERLAAAGITRGCNPPANDRFCPDTPVTRGQMSAFLHRISTGSIRCLANECDQISPRVAPAESWESVGDSTYRLTDELVVVLDSVGAPAVNRAYELSAMFGAELAGGSPGLGAFQLLFGSLPASELVAHRDALRLQDGVAAADFHNAVPALDVVPSEWSHLSSSETWHLSQIGAPAAWEAQSDASSVAVLISDSGIFDGHEDLAFAEPPTRLQEPAGAALRDSTHGTHVAGIACATGNNATSGSHSAAGMAWGCELFGVDWNRSLLRDFDPEGLIDPLWAAHWTRQSVIENDIRVVNMSWSVGPHTSRGCARTDLDQDDPTDAWEKILLNLFGQHPETLFVVSAGNCGFDLDPLVGEPFATVPAAYGPLFSNVITVGSVDADDGRSSFSNWGDSVEVSAPGGFGPGNVGVWSTVHSCPADSTADCTSAYDSRSGPYPRVGTSQAAPIVTGLAALMFAKNPGATPAQVESCILNTTIDILPDSGAPTVVPADALDCIANTWTGCEWQDSIPEAECNALVAFYSAMTWDQWWQDNRAWFTDPDPCNWYGVTCSGGVVTQLSLTEINFHASGSLVPELGDLSNLTHLVLWLGGLSGPIPPELGNLSNLQWLHLAENSLTGSIPPELGNLSSLTRLYLHWNELSGPVPETLQDLPNLSILRLWHNGCLTASTPAFADWLASHDPWWNDGCPS